MQNMQLTNRIKLQCKINNITIKYLLEQCKINRNFIYDVEKNNSLPSCEKLLLIANFFNISVDYLLNRTDNPDINK